MAQERLNKVMANAGIASRRACDALIEAGRVTVNGQVVTELGVKVDPALDQVRVDGDLLKARPSTRRSYLMLYKPAGVLSVFDDPRGRPGLESLLKGPTRLYPVGRLDLDSEGLLLLTDDGDITLKLSHPRFEHSKTYLVLVDRPPGSDTLARYRRGIQLDDGVTAPSQWRVLEHPVVLPPSDDPEAAEGVWLHVTMHEGRKRQIRRMAAAENMQVRRLVRIGVGSLKLDRKLRPGESRPLTRRELENLVEEVESAGPPAAPQRRAVAGIVAARQVGGPRPAGPRREDAPERGPRPSGPRRDDAPERGPRPSGPYRGGPRPTGPRREDAPERGPERGPRPAGPYRGGPRPAGPRREDAPERGPERGPRPAGPRSGDAPERGPRPSGPYRGGPRPAGPRRDDAPERGPRPSGPYRGGPRPAGPRSDDAPERGPRPSGPYRGGPRPAGPRREDAPERGPERGPRPSGPYRGGPRPSGPRREDASERGPARKGSPGRSPRGGAGARPPRAGGNRSPQGAHQARPRPSRPQSAGPKKPRKP